MAEYVVAFVVEKIAKYVIEEAGSLSKVGWGQIEWIETELRRMQCFLKDADSKKDNDERVKNWVAEIRDVAYDTDDIIDSFMLKIERKRRKGLLLFLKRYLFCFTESFLYCKLHKQIKGIRIRIQDIKSSRSTYGIENIGREGERSDMLASRFQEKRRSNPCDLENDVVGLNEDVTTILSFLTRGDSRRSVVSIVGMGGIGKTTLAKKVYLSYDVKTQFDCSAWICVSQENRSKEILVDLGKKLIGLEREELDKMNNDDLVEVISAFLEDKKYIIVLDDIWRCRVWDDLKAAFPENRNGSRIILTTRFRDVAIYADPRSSPHELHLLHDDDSWKLFSKKLCLEWNSCTSLPPWAEDVGKQILQKCGGLPLAIVVLAGLLSRKEANFTEWVKFLQSVHWQLTQDSAQCADILALSYDDLPYYLKSCFLYFGLFPEDFEIPAKKLMLLWVAEGFVQQRGQEPPEDIAEDYLEELIGRSMVQVAKRKSDGRIKFCRVHDLLRELSIVKAKEDYFLDIVHGDHSTLTYQIKGRRVAVHHGSFPNPNNAAKFRSLLCFDLNKAVVREVERFKLLHVLDMEGVHLAQLESAVGNLLNLRYLGLRGTWLRTLPKSVQHLWNLQTLDLRSTLVKPIPVAVWKLRNLRNLYLNELEEMVINPPISLTLPNVQTLQGLRLGRKSRIDNGLDNLTKLRELELNGELQLHEEKLSNWIFMSKDLECLKLQASSLVYDDCNMTLNAIPEMRTFSNHSRLYKLHLGGIIRRMHAVETFPPNLTQLSLQGSFLMEDPMPKLEMLPSLKVLKLKQSSYVGQEMVCSAGGFPQLHVLKMSFLAIDTWWIEEGAMRNLRQLQVIECIRLKIVPTGLRPLTTLKDLKLGYMPHEFKSKIEDRRGEDWYRIHHVLPI